jgi:predicted XRE-type DNA-binding protein
METATKVTESSGNVFADIGVANPKEALAKAKLAARICQLIAERELDQKQAAALLHLDQPKISALMHGKLRGFSLERLFRLLELLDQEIKIHVQSRQRGANLKPLMIPLFSLQQEAVPKRPIKRLKTLKEKSSSRTRTNRERA